MTDRAATGEPDAVEISTRDNEIDGLRTLAFLVGLDVERDALPLGQRLESGPLHCGDVHEYIAAAVVRLDEAVAPLGIEEFDGTCHGHRETPFPRGCSAAGPHGAAARPDIRKRGKQRPYGLPHSAGPHRRRNVKASSRMKIC